MVDWNKVAAVGRDYLASLGSYLYGPIYGLYKGLKGVYHTARSEWGAAKDNYIGALTTWFLQPVYAVYRFATGTAKAFDYQIPW